MIGDKIRERRKELNMTQEELAYKLGYSTKSAINKIEMGVNDVKQSKICDFALALDCSPEYLLGLRVEVSEPSKDLPQRMMHYVQILSKLSPKNQESVFQYIDFLNDRGESE